jgi:hypothetical protein
MLEELEFLEDLPTLLVTVAVLSTGKVAGPGPLVRQSSPSSLSA